VLTHRDTPDIEVMFIESDDGLGPFGAKSMGEASKVPAPAAVANAVFNATGHRFRDLPITAEKIVAAGSSAGQRGEIAKGRGQRAEGKGQTGDRAGQRTEDRAGQNAKGRGQTEERASREVRG